MSFIFRLVAILKAAKTARIAGMAVATLTVTIVFGGSAVWGQTGPLIVVNSLSPIGTADSPGGPVTTFDFATGATVARFIPPRSFDMYSGHGVTVLDNEIYLTALNQADRSSDSIHVFPVNGGAGGAEVRTLPNPRPGLGIQNLSFSGGVLYALTGWTRGPAQIFGLNPVTGAVLTGPVPIAAATPNGFTVLPNGHFLVSSGPCTYTEFDLVTGALIPGTTILCWEYEYVRNKRQLPFICYGLSRRYIACPFEHRTSDRLDPPENVWRGGDHISGSAV